MAEHFLVKTRQVIERTGNRYGINSTARALEAALVEGETGLAIGSCKSLIEGFCKAILDEKGISYSPDSDIAPLARLAVGALGVGAGVEKEKKAREAFMKLVNSLTNALEVAAQAIGELRNDFCPIAHGKPPGHIPLDMHYAEFIARQTDSFLGFVFEMRMSRELLERTDPPEADANFDLYVNDEFSSTEIYGDVYTPAEILININPDRYHEALTEYREQQAENDEA